MNSLVIRISTAALAVTISLFQSHSIAEDLLVSGTIKESLSGSLNTIAGSATLVGGQLHLPNGSTLSRIEFSLVSFSSNPTLSLPESLGFSMYYAYPNTVSYDTSSYDIASIAFSRRWGIQIGDTVSIAPYSMPYNIMNPFLGLFDNYGQTLPSLRSGAFWDFGGIDATAQSEISIKAFGVAAPIPEPSTYLMMLAGLGLVGMAAKRNSKQAV